MYPSVLSEDEYMEFKCLDDTFVLFHVANGKLWYSETKEQGDYDLPDAEEITPNLADKLANQHKFLSQGRIHK